MEIEKVDIHYLDAIHHKGEVFENFGKQIAHPSKMWIECLETRAIMNDKLYTFDNYKDEFITLSEIVKELKPSKVDTILVIAESTLGGVVYRYNNYGKKEWIITGVLRGYA